MNHNAALHDAAVAVLRRNDLGTMTTAAPDLYPHMWSWDSAFITIGLARIDIPRAVTELRTLLHAQWRTGMLPHVIFSSKAPDYFPGPDRWGTADADACPGHVRTTGICQPPVQAIALRHVLDRARENGGDDRELAETFAKESFDGWVEWHRWLARARDPEGVGLVRIHHGWESGFDNSPRWDPPYARIDAPDMAFPRRDIMHVADPAERPTDTEYAKYLLLVDQMRAVGFDDAEVMRTVDFCVEDVFFSAVLAAASGELAAIGEDLGRDDVAAELREIAGRFRRGVTSTVNPSTGLARDRDVRSGTWIDAETIAGFAPLVAGGDPDLLTRQRELLTGPDWMGHPTLRFPLPPSTSPSSATFRPRTYWRGPVWPFLVLLLGWTLGRDGQHDLADALREASLCQLADRTFGEYYDPLTGDPLGSLAQSWTAAAVLEWLGRG